LSATESSWSTVSGVSLYYVRDGKFRTTVRSTYHFEDKCDRFIQDVKNFTPHYGVLREVWTAGAYVNKDGFHGEGRAFDLDGLVFDRAQVMPYQGHHNNSNRTVRRRYTAVNACAHREFRYVLHGWYNFAHRDHIHVDDGGGARLLRKNSRSDVTFIQSAMNDLMDAGLAIDGVYGSSTDRWYRESKVRAGVSGDTSSDVSAWLAWNWQIAYHGFYDLGL
jgi:hypothetical protein